jgi:16S rRNA (adenine1518-N6/adenine1519-N6)-dimethyltransferase
MKRSRRKRLGQHFLADDSVAARICGLLAEQPPRVLEIGPGQGALTAPLVERFERVLALEVDPHLVPDLARRFAEHGLEVREADALKEPMGPLLEAEAPWQLAANLPYSVGTAILRRLLPWHQLLTRLVVMLQHEVVERLVAQPGDREHGLMALERAAFATAWVAFRVSPRAFRPRPRVESSVVVLELQPPVYDSEALGRALALAARALTNRRKMLSNALRSELAPAQIVAAGLDPEARPGTISLDGWVRLATHPPG